MKRLLLYAGAMLVLVIFGAGCSWFGGEDKPAETLDTPPIVDTGQFIGKGTDLYGKEFTVWLDRYTYYIKFQTLSGLEADPFYQVPPEDKARITVEVTDCVNTPGSEIVIKGFQDAYPGEDKNGNGATDEDEYVILPSAAIFTNIDAERFVTGGSKFTSLPADERFLTDTGLELYGRCLGNASNTSGPSIQP